MRGGFTLACPWPPPFTRYVGANQKPSRLGPSVEIPRKHFGSPDSCDGLEAMLSSEWKKPNSTVLSVTPRRRHTFPEARNGFSSVSSPSRSAYEAILSG